ncbi:hypothetical protein CLOM_g13185, partial [Closterium sp. NIES-68]
MDLQHHYSQHRVVGRALVDFWTLSNEKAE